MVDQFLTTIDNALRTLHGVHRPTRPTPRPATEGAALSAEDRKRSGALMRVNHVGEVCAQALYHAQALTTRSPSLQLQFIEAAREETDHLAWTQQRLDELGARPSLLNPLWYAGAFAVGWVAGRSGDATSLGFVVETEHQVEDHLQSHLQRLPENDAASRAIVEQMKADEIRHAESAQNAGAARLPLPVKWVMRAAAKVMTRTAHHI